MANVVARHYAPLVLGRPLGRLAVAFAAGFLAVLIFHQGMLVILHATGVTPAVPYSLRPTAPLGVPQVWSSAFWGGLWGLLLALLWPASPARGRYLAVGLIFGAILPTLVAWFVVAPLKGLPVAGGGHPSAIATGLLVNAAWGFGAALLIIAAPKVLHLRDSAS